MTNQNHADIRIAVSLRILKLIEKMWSHEGAARDFSDPEGVHQMRVTSRKLRAALDSSRDLFPKKRHRRLHKKVRALTRALGDVRDADVIRAELEALNDGDGAGNHPGIARLIDRLTGERDAARVQLITVLDDLAASGFHEESIAAFTNSGKQDKKPKIRRRDAKRMVVDHVQAFVDQTRSMPPEEEVEGLHRVRITIKRLRYTLQFLGKPLAPESRPLIAGLTNLQDILGEIHNQDVLMELIRDELHVMADEAADQATHAYPSPADAANVQWQDLLSLVGRVADRRRLLYGSFTSRWQEMESKGFTDDLDTLTRPRP